MSTSQIQRVNLSKVDHSLKSRRGKKSPLVKNVDVFKSQLVKI